MSAGLSVGILSLASRLGLGAGICISNILDTEWGQTLLTKTCFRMGTKPFMHSNIYSTKNIFRKNHRNYWKTRVVWCIEVLVTMGKAVVLMWTRLVRG
jgi:hypothetical protein